jgi:hypothetical protein
MTYLIKQHNCRHSDGSVHKSVIGFYLFFSFSLYSRDSQSDRTIRAYIVHARSLIEKELLFDSYFVFKSHIISSDFEGPDQD